MPIDFGYFSHETNFKSRFYPDYEKLQKQVEYLKGLGAKIVLTSGSFDLFHIGHALYLESAKKCGDILIVDLDYDGTQSVIKMWLEKHYGLGGLTPKRFKYLADTQAV